MAADEGELNILEELSKHLRVEFGLPLSPIESLKNDDDWAFVIKMHGLVEATVNEALAKRFNDPNLSEVVRHLPLANDRSGKLAFIKAFNLLPNDACFL